MFSIKWYILDVLHIIFQISTLIFIDDDGLRKCVNHKTTNITKKIYKGQHTMVINRQQFINYMLSDKSFQSLDLCSY